MDGAPLSPPSGGSPFSPFGAASNAVITVGDILSQLPPEIARANGAMPDQPVTISPQALEAAISSGQLAVPMFEIYRVCPALFQAPVSPHDPRLVPLPRNKSPGLIAAHTGALAKPAQQPQSAGASPFGQAASPFAAAPMQMPPAHGQAPASPFAPALPICSHSNITTRTAARQRAEFVRQALCPRAVPKACRHPFRRRQTLLALRECLPFPGSRTSPIPRVQARGP